MYICAAMYMLGLIMVLIAHFYMKRIDVKEKEKEDRSNEKDEEMKMMN